MPSKQILIRPIFGVHFTNRPEKKPAANKKRQTNRPGEKSAGKKRRKKSAGRKPAVRKRAQKKETRNRTAVRVPEFPHQPKTTNLNEP